jgi:hypothetical protein
MESAATPGGRGVCLIAIGAIALWRSAYPIFSVWGAS